MDNNNKYRKLQGQEKYLFGGSLVYKKHKLAVGFIIKKLKLFLGRDKLTLWAIITRQLTRRQPLFKIERE